jgi:hypothetical protein
VFAGLGAAEVLRADPDNKLAATLLADAATAVGPPGAYPDWPWPQPRLTYANAALAEVVIAAGHLRADPAQLAAGLRMLAWLRDIQLDRGHLSVIPVRGRQRGVPVTRYDQQPIEVAALADACATAAAVTGDLGWSDTVRLAAAWFDGDNDAGTLMWDPETSGGYDGLTADGPNLNQGAESTLALLSTVQQARRIPIGVASRSLSDLNGSKRPVDGVEHSGSAPLAREFVMIREAEVFLLADEAMVRVFRQIRDEHWDTELPPLFDMPGADKPVPLRQAVNHHAYDDAWVPDMLAGRTMDEVGRDRFDGDLLGTDPHGNVARIASAAAAAARQVTDRDAIVHCSYGDVPVWDYFWQLNVARTVATHDVAALIGVDDALPEELCRGMWDGTEPSAETWRSFGIFRQPVPVPADAPWRDRFLGLTGRRP